MKILHLLESSRFSGAENLVCQIINIMSGDPQYEVVYCSRDGQIRQALNERGVTFAPIQELSVREVRRVLAQEKPDLIHAHDMRASFIAAVACGRVPLVSHIHNNAFDSRWVSLKSVAYALAAWKAQHVIWVSRTAFDGYAFRRLFTAKSTVLRNIIDVDMLYQKMENDSDREDYDVVYLGRLTYPKNPQRLLRICRRVADLLPNVRIAIVGTGELEEEIRALHQELGLQNNVFLLGFRSNPFRILHDAKVMLMTSRWEGLPMCALEAMALGVPIVSTAVDGLIEVVDHGENGYICDDDVVLAQHVADIVSDEKLHQKLSASAGAKGREINEREPYLQAIMKIYGNAIDE